MHTDVRIVTEIVLITYLSMFGANIIDDDDVVIYTFRLMCRDIDVF